MLSKQAAAALERYRYGALPRSPDDICTLADELARLYPPGWERFDPAVVDYVQSVADSRGCPWVEALEIIITSTPGFRDGERRETDARNE